MILFAVIEFTSTILSRIAFLHLLIENHVKMLCLQENTHQWMSYTASGELFNCIWSGSYDDSHHIDGVNALQVKRGENLVCPPAKAEEKYTNVLESATEITCHFVAPHDVRTEAYAFIFRMHDAKDIEGCQAGWIDMQCRTKKLQTAYSKRQRNVSHSAKRISPWIWVRCHLKLRKFLANAQRWGRTKRVEAVAFRMANAHAQCSLRPRKPEDIDSCERAASVIVDGFSFARFFLLPHYAIDKWHNAQMLFRLDGSVQPRPNIVHKSVCHSSPHRHLPCELFR